MRSKTFLTADWEWLAMMNYVVPAALLQPHLPPNTSIDYWNDQAIVSVVGFLFNNTKVMGVRWPGLTNFEEVNLRYYLTSHDGTNQRRGVGFISEIVPSSIIAGTANLLYNEHYSVAKMSHKIAVTEKEIVLDYYWQKKGQQKNSLRVTAANDLQDIARGSEEEFIFEHYYGYNRLNKNTSIEYSLEHPRWQVYPVKTWDLQCDVAQLYGAEFVPYIQDAEPQSVFLARGSRVKVFTPRRIASPSLHPSGGTRRVNRI